MTDITYDKVTAAPAKTGGGKTARTSLWRLIFEAMVEARKLQAERIVKDHRALFDGS
jgi:hypothetical protein